MKDDSTTPESLARKAEYEYRAREILASRPPILLALSVSLGVTIISIYGVIASALPLPTATWLLLTTALVPSLAIEVWYLRRRLEASLILLGLSRGRV